jgi:rare lipoprotein A
MHRRWVFAIVLCAGCAHQQGTPGFRPPVGAISAEANQGEDGLTFARNARAPNIKPDQTGRATWYGGAFAGRKTANGERFDPTRYTAAHRKLPFGTWVEVRRVDTGRTVRVRINDRGPYGDDRRVIDLSRKAAEELGMVRDGMAQVELRIVGGP